MKLKTSSLLMAGALFGTAMMPAQANNEAMLDLLKVLRDQGTITAANYELLANAAKADKEAAEAVKTDVANVTKKMPKITTKGKIKIESADGNWSFQPIGRVMADFIEEDGDGLAEQDGAELRRARLGFAGKIYDMGYKFEADFAGGGASIKDAYVSYGNKIGDNKYTVKVGQSHIPFGLNAKVSSKYMSFMDRPLFADSAISPTRQPGFAVQLNDPKYKWLINAGYHYAGGSGYKGYSGQEALDGDGKTFAIRGSFLPYMKDKNHLLQIGAGYLNLNDAPSSFKFDQRLVSHIGSKEVKGQVSDFDGADAFTFDFLGVYGSFHAMGEYLSYEMDSESGSDVEIDGYAVEAGYFLTGESLKWKKGYTSGITPKSSSGAWQVAARFETLEIDDTSAGDDEVDKISFAVNYYPTKNTRFKLDYDKVLDFKQNGANVDSEPSAIKARAEVFW